MKALTGVDYFKAWLAYTLGASIVGSFMFLFIGIFLTLILRIAGLSLPQIRIINAIVGLILGIPFSYFAFRFVIDRLLMSKIQNDSPPLAA